MTDVQIWQLIGGCGFVTGAASVVVALINKRKAPVDVQAMEAAIQKTQNEASKVKVEMESFVVETLTAALNELRKDRESDRRDLQLSKQEIEENRKTIREAMQANDDCEFEHGITRLQLNKVLRKIDMDRWIKSSVYVLDDNKLVTDVFVHRFRTIPVVNFKAFTKWREFLADVQRERPEIVVMDDGVTTEEDTEEVTAPMVIAQFGYMPEILVMSGTKENELKYKGTDVKFFYKDNWYIRNITKTILEHLIHKNQ
jgi:hypothetical protein